MNNHGLNLELEQAHQKPEDWVLGSAGKECIAKIPFDVVASFLPEGEIQRGVEDTMDCATRAPINILETKFNYLLSFEKFPQSHIDFLINNGYVDENGVCTFSDAFVAIKSGTTRNGNSLIAPLDAIRTNGLVPKKLLPLLPTMTFDEYHEPSRITDNIGELGKKFLTYFTINYEKVFATQYPEVTREELIDVGAFAWPNPIDGVYPRTEQQPNHAFAIFGKPDFRAFDNYPDSSPTDFIKQLSTDYQFLDHGYRVIISLNELKKRSLIQRLLEVIKKLFNL